jgi:transposase
MSPPRAPEASSPEKIANVSYSLDLDRAAKLRAEGLSFDRVAAVLGVSTGTIHAALKRLQESSSADPHSEA